MVTGCGEVKSTWSNIIFMVDTSEISSVKEQFPTTFLMPFRCSKEQSISTCIIGRIYLICFQLSKRFPTLGGDHLSIPSDEVLLPTHNFESCRYLTFFWKKASELMQFLKQGRTSWEYSSGGFFPLVSAQIWAWNGFVCIQRYCYYRLWVLPKATFKVQGSPIGDWSKKSHL